MRTITYVCDKCAYTVTQEKDNYSQLPDGWYEIKLSVDYDTRGDSYIFCKECCGPIENLKERRRQEKRNAEGLDKDPYGQPQVPPRKLKNHKNIAMWLYDKLSI